MWWWHREVGTRGHLRPRGTRRFPCRPERLSRRSAKREGGRSGSNPQVVPELELLIVHEQLVDVVGMRRAAAERVAQYLKRVLHAAGIVDVHVGAPLVAADTE